MAENGQDHEYILGTEERRRLELLQQCADPTTIRALDDIGIKPGWRCLELGAGAGSIAQLMCHRAGPTGSVVAVDLDTRFLDELPEDNLEVVRRDVLAEGIPGDAYDLVHARALLMHLPTREKFVGEMAATLRPGGWLVIEDLDTYPFTAAEGVYGDVMSKATEAFHMANTASTFGRQLPALFDAAGLEEVEAVCEVMHFRGGAPYAQLIVASMAQLRPLLLAVGATDDQLADFQRETADPTKWFYGFALCSVRGRAPAA
jgi:SAM-dependent methyltransferase